MNIPESIRVQAAKLYGIDPNAMPVLGGMDGIVYACQRDRIDLALKITPLPAKDVDDKTVKAQELHTFVTYLCDHDVPIAKTISSLDGNPFEIIVESNQTYMISCAMRAPGHHVRARFMNEWNDAMFTRWGQIMGRMHALTGDFAKEHGVLQIGDWKDEVKAFTQMCTDTPIRQHWHRIAETLSSFDTPPEAFGLIHNDLHPRNFLVNGETITIIDFDVANYHWFATDIGIALFHALWMRLATRSETPRAFALRFLNHFMAGYRREHQLPTEWLLKLPGFVDYRRIVLYTVFENDPGFGKTPWEKQTLYDWRRGILNNKRVVNLRPEDLLTV